jgi:hypothetical protein
MDRDELLEHYDFYVDNCQEWEIPISFEEWVREYKDDLEFILNNLIRQNEKPN